MKFFLTISIFFKSYFSKKRKKNNSMKVFLLTMKKLKMSKNIDILKFVHRFYAVEISKTIVFLIE